MMRGKPRTFGMWIALYCAIAVAGATAAHGKGDKEKMHPTNIMDETQPAPSISQQVELVTGADTLRGTLLVPTSDKPVPLVIFLSGSGPTDRNGNSAVIRGRNDCLLMLADSLRDDGIATLRYDKRGVGASARAMKSESDLLITTYSDDAVLWAKKYRNDARFSTMTYAGHSEGALIGTLAAKQEKPDGLVLLAGAGRPAYQVIHEQLKKSLSPELVERADSIADTLMTGRTVHVVPPILMSLYRPPTQPYMRSWLGVDPVAELAEVKVPTMVIWGTSDIQMTRLDADKLASSRGGIRKLIVPNMNHVLKLTLDDPVSQIGSYSDPTLIIAPGLIEPLARFIKGVKRES
jgi:pimeloyl-ACP methyl ester carboxylesterase